MGSDTGTLNQLNVTNCGATFVVADLLTTAPGTYVVLVVAGASVGFGNVTIGPIGPAGAEGPQGPPGLPIPNVVRLGDSTEDILGINYVIALTGLFPPRNVEDVPQVSPFSVGPEQYIGSIGLFAGTFPPRGWEFCDGQLLPISGNESLFAIIGTLYGGDGRTNFALPDLRGRVPVHTTIH